MEFCEPFSSCVVLQSLVATELRTLDSFALLDAIMKGIKNALAEAVEMGILTTDKGVRHALFCFIEMALTNILHHGLTKNLIHKSFKR